MDVSIVLNAHRESLFVVSTLRSLKNATNLAQENGIEVELVVVLDDSDEATISIIDSYASSNFTNVKLVKVDFNSLSQSRNTGVKESVGKYVFTADADDLISRNTISDFFELAENYEGKFAFFMQYLIAFGEKYYVAEFSDSDSLTDADFIANNPYTSRIFISREKILSYMYREIENKSGFAFEDWDLTNRLYSDGFKFKTLKDSVLFYRIRNDGLLSLSNLTGNKLVPRSELHTIQRIVDQQLSDQTFQGIELSEVTLSNKIINDPVLRQVIYEAIETDPTILIDLIGSAIDWSPRPVNLEHWSNAYLNASQIIGSDNFSDVLLLQTLNPGGAEKYIFQIISSIEKYDPQVKILVVALDSTDKHLWLENLNENCTFIDLANTYPYLSSQDLHKLLINLLLTVCKFESRIHVKTSLFGQSLLTNFREVLSSRFRIIYYRFSDAIYELDGRQFRDGHIVKFLRDTLPDIHTVLTDNSNIIKKDLFIFGDWHIKKYKKINNFVEVNQNWKRINPSFKLFWASRICHEKRPDLVPIILKAIQEKIPEISIDVYGKNELPDFIAKINEMNSIKYCGGFESFDEIPISNYDFLIYTSRFDGTPNVLVEASASGVPVVAPNIGGISEVYGDLLFLVEDSADDVELGNSYAELILSCYDNWSRTLKNAELIKSLVSENFSRNEHEKAVFETFFKKSMQ